MSLVVKSTHHFLVFLLVLLSGCGYRIARFAPGPVVQRADDRRPIPLPAARLDHDTLYDVESRTEHVVVQNMSVARPPVAEDVNRLDEVVESSWHRGPETSYTLEGYERDGPPEPPLLVLDDQPVSGPVAGNVAVRDARGLDYDLHFDPPSYPESRTAAWPIASRLVHALGYHVAEAHVVTAPSGRRAVALRRPSGRDLGPTPLLWTRDDDPNDRIAHVDRRSLRASSCWMKWLDVTRVSEATLRDVFIGPPHAGFVEHRVVDLSGALGAARLDENLERATAPFDDDTGSGWLLLSFGFAPIDPPLVLPTTGRGPIAFTPQVHDLKAEVSPPFAPHDHLRPDDLYWMARQMAQISAAVIDEAVRAARFSRAETADQIRARLRKRRLAVLDRAYREVTPVRPESFRIARGDRSGSIELQLVDDQAVVKLAEPTRSYHVGVYDGDRGELRGEGAVVSDEPRFGVSIRLRSPLPRVVVVRIGRVEGDGLARPMEIHLDVDGGRVRGLLH